jgi:uncharacterized protein (DUF2249 family)
MDESHTDRVLNLIGKPSHMRNMCVFQAYEAMRPGSSFEFCTEHNPADLYSQLLTEHAENLAGRTWQVNLETGAY